jgi:putative addiction module component (TIGR02574 family)
MPAGRSSGLFGAPLGCFGAPLGCSGSCWYDPVMASTAESVLQDALKLPEEDRAEIAARLIASLDAESNESRDEVEEAWAAEIERRCEALDAGTTTTRSWEEVRRRIEADLLRK